MTTEIKTHRWNQIGGCITEISTEKTRILIDFGEELPGSRNKKGFPFPWEERKVDAVLFTHYHGDHIGRFSEAYQHADVYMSELSRDVLVNIHGHLAKHLPLLAEWKPEKAARLAAEAQSHADTLARLNGPRVHLFRPHESRTFPVGEDIRVTPFWVDHSAADACMLLIETGDKTILHTGDFRGHGLHGEGGQAVLSTVRRLAERKPIDSLVIEGTMMSRSDGESYSEEDLFRDAGRLLAHHKHVFLVISSTNLDSIQTFYRAAANRRLPFYVYNRYCKTQLETLGKYAGERWEAPTFEDVEQLRSPSRLREGGVVLIKANEQGRKLLESCADCRPAVVYSMWPGYYKRKLDPDLCAFVEACREKSIPVYPLTDSTYGPLHTSGHASLELIAEVIRAANPRALYPIHTEDAWEFLRLDIPDPLKEELQNRMIQEGETGGYSPEEDHRCLSDAALAKFLPGNPWCKFIDLVKAHPGELAFCFRGNSENAAVIYYRNHVAFHITAKGYVKFNFDHARYLKPEAWSAQRELLLRCGYSFEKKQQERPRDGSESIGYVTMPPEAVQKLTPKALEALYTGSIRQMIDSFSEAQGLKEKSVQQQLFLSTSFKTLRDGCFFYDMEFRQPYGRLLHCKNQPDMLGIRFDAAGVPRRMLFAEVKSTLAALGGESGLDAHIRGMEAYPPGLLPIRGLDACRILQQYRALGLLEECPTSLQEADFTSLPREILLIFTGKDTIDALGNYAALLREYTEVTDEFPWISVTGPIAIYRRALP